jgi:hypothetical protein
MTWAHNIGHENAITTYNAYRDFSPDQQFEVIERLGRKTEKAPLSDIEAIAEAVARRMQSVNIQH